ncbi:uncharacterized protein LOC111713270 [Eurytemora carolleeae]|uniref:uncharacterized protein LOC111713270 n=1 Tax=Eurytemora carolleeae TaxID=1294199 RepID=UPI000C75EE3C|nr:uncharacterized protein LOC111713270 [Eurytemora carolleeae]|eukprot:XP_023343874.1 uncharacterized protein LOC111713270 [Eurytemora affinis]
MVPKVPHAQTSRDNKMVPKVPHTQTSRDNKMVPKVPHTLKPAGTKNEVKVVALPDGLLALSRVWTLRESTFEHDPTLFGMLPTNEPAVSLDQSKPFDISGRRSSSVEASSAPSSPATSGRSSRGSSSQISPSRIPRRSSSKGKPNQPDIVVSTNNSVLVSASPRILRKNFKAEGRARSHQRKLSKMDSSNPTIVISEDLEKIEMESDNEESETTVAHGVAELVEGFAQVVENVIQAEYQEEKEEKGERVETIGEMVEVDEPPFTRDVAYICGEETYCEQLINQVGHFHL